jgi:hypothetical protein
MGIWVVELLVRIIRLEILFRCFLCRRCSIEILLIFLRWSYFLF